MEVYTLVQISVTKVYGPTLSALRGGGVSNFEQKHIMSHLISYKSRES